MQDGDDSPDLTNDYMQVPIWLQVEVEDVLDFDFEAPLRGSDAAECHDLSDLYNTARKSESGAEGSVPSLEVRVFSFLGALTDLHFKPSDRNEPYGAHFIFEDRRSAILSDFSEKIDLLEELGVRAENPVLKARLCDVAWLLDRKRGKLAITAITSYTSIIKNVQSGGLKFRFSSSATVLDPDARDILCRAMQIGRDIGWNKREVVEAREVVRQVLDSAFNQREINCVIWFLDLDLDFRVSDPLELAMSLESFIASLDPLTHYNTMVDLWRLAARAYHAGRDFARRDFCRTAAADCMASAAANLSAGRGTAMMASHLLASAIHELHGIAGQKERRRELRHNLVDRQSEIQEEMSSFSHELDLSEIAEYTKGAIEKIGLLDKFFAFADLGTSPTPEKLIEDAKEALKGSFLSSLFATSYLDREGKTIHRTEGNFGIRNDPAAIDNQIAQSEGLRRQLIARGSIEVARTSIMSSHYVSEDALRGLLMHSPFIPSHLLQTFSRGFARFFQGDLTSATYILIPLLEASLRHILKSSGQDVTIFDDASLTQKDHTLSSLFTQMRTELDEFLTPAIAADIENLFLKKPGPFLRHALAHGLANDGTPYSADAIYACWFIFRLCLIPLFSYREELRSSYGYC